MSLLQKHLIRNNLQLNLIPQIRKIVIASFQSSRSDIGLLIGYMTLRYLLVADYFLNATNLADQFRLSLFCRKITFRLASIYWKDVNVLRADEEIEEENQILSIFLSVRITYCVKNREPLLIFKNTTILINVIKSKKRKFCKKIMTI